MANVYFELTRAFNEHGVIAVLGSGQAVVYHRLAIMSKDGDWILREDDEAFARVLAVLEERGARYRPAAPLAPPWLRSGWSSHLEFRDDAGHRIRCDFFSRPPRLTAEELGLRSRRAFPTVCGPRPGAARASQADAAREGLRRDHRAGEAATPGTRDRVDVGPGPAPRTREGGKDERARDGVRRVRAYTEAGHAYPSAFQRAEIGRLPLREAHEAAVDLARALLPTRPDRLSP